MSRKLAAVALRLEGPLQSWGYESELSRRTTGMMPTKSAVAGICCASLVYNRGCQEEQVFINAFVRLNMIAIALPNDFSVHRMSDFHTILNTKTAEGKIKNSHMTYRQYLNDSKFGIVLSGDKTVILQIADALKDPVWGVFLGRKCCIPSAPVWAGTFDAEADAIQSLLGSHELAQCRVQQDAAGFEDGQDFLSDVPISFKSTNRQFRPRRIRNQ